MGNAGDRTSPIALTNLHEIIVEVIDREQSIDLLSEVREQCYLLVSLNRPNQPAEKSHLSCVTIMLEISFGLKGTVS
jgi:hypothetical protein